ncbi:MAG: threonine synthase [Myxococcota bacterium]|jgi:threonine synthase
MARVSHLVCLRCGTQHVAGDVPHVCTCRGILDVIPNPDDAKALTVALLEGRPHSIWRYAELLPLPMGAEVPPQPVGWTPIIESPRLAAWCGVERLLLKDDGRNPSASFKDRASAVASAHARVLGYDTLACASTGNAASSLACMTAGMGQRAVIFIPEEAPVPKVTQLLAFGATVIKVRGGYAKAYELCSAACERFGWYNRNCAINPYLVEGKKTCGLEIGEQLADDPPDVVAVSVGDGCTMGAIWKGLGEMYTLGILPRLPTMLGVQADGARPLVDAFEDGIQDAMPTETYTVADSINVGTPRNDMRALQAAYASKGALISVSDMDIVEAVKATPRLAGVFAEPAAAAAVAGVRAAALKGTIDTLSTVLVVITGNGLKDIETARSAVGEAMICDPDIDALEALLP